MKKKQCIFFGNCQAAHISNILRIFADLDDEYDIECFSNYEMQDPSQPTSYNSEKSQHFKRYVENADLIIYQPLGTKHGCYSTNKNDPNSFFSLVKPDAKLVSFPRLYTSVLWPLFHKRENVPIFCGSIKNLPNSLEECLYMYDNNLLEFNFEDRVKQDYLIAKQKDNECDVKIADYIYTNIHKKRLFITDNHPVAEVFIEVAKQITSILNRSFRYESALKMAITYPKFLGMYDITYHREDSTYPISRYAINYFHFDYVKQEDSDADIFYRNILTHYYIEVILKKSIGSYPNLFTSPYGISFQQERRIC